MYAVIRTGGKQYRVAPGDKLKIETVADNGGLIEFADILAVSGEEGKFEGQLDGAKVLASVVSSGRGEKILVFKLKRKKQYKKMQGHRQNFVEVRINEIQVNGKTFNMESEKAAAPAETPVKTPKAAKPAAKPAKAVAEPIDGSSLETHESPVVAGTPKPPAHETEAVETATSETVSPESPEQA